MALATSSTSHIEHMSASRASELLHRRSHMGHAKIKALPNACADAPKLLSSAHAGEHTCPHCAQANIKKASHSGSLDTPADRPGKLHVDLKAEHKCGKNTNENTNVEHKYGNAFKYI